MNYFISVLMFLFFSFINLEAFNANHAKRIVAAAKKGVEGWCSDEKSALIIDTINSYRPDVCVEIGVFGGASILPIATSLKLHNHGCVYAIDPWETSECTKGQSVINAKWWSTVDLNYVYNSYLNMLKKNGLDHFVKTLKTTSEAAITRIPEVIDFLHIDGNHSTESVKIDVELYFPRVRNGGYILCDDWLWAMQGRFTTKPIYETMLDKCEIVAQVDKGNCVLLKRVRS